jgi:hypothetical protein
MWNGLGRLLPPEAVLHSHVLQAYFDGGTRILKGDQAERGGSIEDRAAEGRDVADG